MKPVVECTIPILPVRSLGKSIAFYTKTLGFVLDWGDAGSTVCSVSRDGKPIMLRESAGEFAPAWVWIGLEDDSLFGEFQARGVEVLQPPKNYTWAYEMKFRDIDGNVLWLGTEPRKDLPFEGTAATRLKLVDGNLELLTAAVASNEALGALLGVSVADDWSGFPEALPILRESYAKTPGGQTWGSLFFVDSQSRTLVGFGGFKGPPSAEGAVEIGYAISPAFQGQGLATDAVAQMVQRAFASAAIRAVDAHTLGHANPSTRVLEKSGFRKIGDVHDPDAGVIWQWRRERPRVPPH